MSDRTTRIKSIEDIIDDNPLGNVGILNSSSVRIDPATESTLQSIVTALTATTLADNMANPTALSVASFGALFDGSTWDRMRSVAALGDGGTAALASGIYLYNGTTWDRVRGDITNGLDVDVTRLPAGTNLIGKVQDIPSTTDGWDVANFTSADTYTALTSTAQVVKASAGAFGGYYYGNPNTVACWILLYDVAAASVTVGTTTPKLAFWIPAGSAANVEISKGIPFTNAGWSCAAVMTTAGGNTAPTTPLEVMVYYK